MPNLAERKRLIPSCNQIEKWPIKIYRVGEGEASVGHTK